MKNNHNNVNNSVCTVRAFAMVLALCATAASTATEVAAPPGLKTPAAACPASLNYTFPRLQDEKPQSLCQYAGKVLVVVNTASFCGYTGQYKGLEALYAKYKDKGLVVLGFPSNAFEQETGSNKQIADFCENTYGVKFPMFSKTDVTGKSAHPFYQQLALATGTAPRWNFHKYVVARNGQVTANFAARVAPEDRAFLMEIEKQLQQP
jgi:glutathione peroxidase